MWPSSPGTPLPHEQDTGQAYHPLVFLFHFWHRTSTCWVGWGDSDWSPSIADLPMLEGGSFQEVGAGLRKRSPSLSIYSFPGIEFLKLQVAGMETGWWPVPLGEIPLSRTRTYGQRKPSVLSISCHKGAPITLNWEGNTGKRLWFKFHRFSLYLLRFGSHSWILF